jgi:cholesterol oxidase
MGLALEWKRRKAHYDFVIIGSGYGGAITAARIAAADLNPKPSVCILERGKEWLVGSFPDSLDRIIAEQRSSANPLGLYELLTYRDISVIKGSGLGGTSLVNANVALVPDPETFALAGWPAPLGYDQLQPFYERARATLDAQPHPRAAELLKVQALARRARELGRDAAPLDLTVNFQPGKTDPFGLPRTTCNDCGDCVTGCNVGAKNTLHENYLPMAAKAGAETYTQTKVEWIEKLPDGGWRIHGRHYRNNISSERFNILAGNVILAAGSINTTEILMRSEMHGLAVSPRLGSAFSGNGDFFGLAYNGDFRTDVLGTCNKGSNPGLLTPPGPTIVAAVRYNGSLPAAQRTLIEDLSFPSGYVTAAKTAFAFFRGDDTDIGDEASERERVARDLRPFVPTQPDGALNHTMLYLCMGFDDARGSMVFEAPWFEPDGRMRIEWDDAGRQVVFAKINEELRRHARAQGATFIQNPMWTVFNLRHLITAHPLGGCPIGEDYLQGAVDAYGRVFSGDGSVHRGLFVADGSLIPSALGVNPFLTISALAEWIAERKVREIGGEAYPAPPTAVSMSVFDPVEATGYREGELEKLFRRVRSMPIDTMMNNGGRQIDLHTRTIRNDEYWKGFFPKGHVLNALSSAIFTGFKKRFFRAGNQFGGVTSDTDGRINARNALEELNLTTRQGDLEPGRYVLLRYLDPPWQGYYDVFKIVNDDLMIGRVYLGQFPNGTRLFTFPMTRVYGFDQMTVDDHARLYRDGTVPSRLDVSGVWRMDAISNANRLGAIAHLQFDPKPDGRLEARYQLLGLIEGLVVPSFLSNHFRLTDFTQFHDEIRMVTPDFMVGKYVMDLPPGIASLFPAVSLGLLHVDTEGGKRFGFYYTLTRTGLEQTATGGLLRPFLDVHLPSGIGMTFDEEMVGWYWPGEFTGAPGRESDLAIADRLPRDGHPEGAGECSFRLRLTVRDINEFIEGAAHEAQPSGTISFENFDSQPSFYTVDERKSRFQYLTVNPATGEAEIRYYLVFTNAQGRRFLFDGRKYMQKDEAIGRRGINEVRDDYTTLFCHVYELTDDGSKELGTAYLKFRTFEDLDAFRNLTDFLRSFRITGTSDPLLQLQAQMRFLAFTAQFVLREYDPLAPEPASLAPDVRDAVLRNADTPDYFSTRSSSELQAALRASNTQPLESLINTGSVRIDFEKRRIFRDVFWKGSFGADTPLGWEERVRNSVFGAGGVKDASIYTGGSFWKRFDGIADGAAFGHVVNYELEFIPGKPQVRQVQYPDSNRAYFNKGDDVLLLTYLNQPYRIVYDTIKVIDEDSALGVMHLGEFPNGVEFATFVMERHNYPFEKMSVKDHQLIFSDPRARSPHPDEVTGEWSGHLVLLPHPNAGLLNQVNPVLFRLTFEREGETVRVRYRFGLVSGSLGVQFSDDYLKLTHPTAFQDEIRLIADDMLIGRSASPELNPLLLRGLQDYLDPRGERFLFYYILTRN